MSCCNTNSHCCLNVDVPRRYAHRSDIPGYSVASADSSRDTALSKAYSGPSQQPDRSLSQKQVVYGENEFRIYTTYQNVGNDLDRAFENLQM
jgi:hypothetical protein